MSASLNHGWFNHPGGFAGWANQVIGQMSRRQRLAVAMYADEEVATIPMFYTQREIFNHALGRWAYTSEAGRASYMASARAVTQ